MSQVRYSSFIQENKQTSGVSLTVGCAFTEARSHVRTSPPGRGYKATPRAASPHRIQIIQTPNQNARGYVGTARPVRIHTRQAYNTYTNFVTIIFVTLFLNIRLWPLQNLIHFLL